IGTGTALFKPPVQGAVAKSLDEKNSSLGFGIFYWIVNIGGFIAPMAASTLRGDTLNPTWNLVFFGAAIVTALNFLPAIFLFKEPERPSAAQGAVPSKRNPVQVLKDTLLILWNDKSMLRFLLVVSGFWLMFMQLWDLLPNFLDEWVDTRSVGAFLTSLPLIGGSDFVATLLMPSGAAKPEIIINIDSAAIILLVLPLSWFFGRYRMMTSLVLGMVISLVGFVLSGMTMSGSIASLAIFIFAIGEIICSPKFNEYIGMTAPPDKKAIYMGFANIPFAIGWAAGNGLSGVLYDGFSSKEMLARRFLFERGGDEAALTEMKGEALYDQVAAALGSNATIEQVNDALWSAYHPWIIWPMLGAVGLASLIGMILIHKGMPASAAPEATTESPAIELGQGVAESKASTESSENDQTSPKSADSAIC
ncbi:MAG: MFS transporter, partial [Myxococcales bacterium]|nr:MFS transporter [Myxococcales bacterium]